MYCDVLIKCVTPTMLFSKHCCSPQMSPRKQLTIGLVAAVLTGLVAGTMYVPLHYAGSVRDRSHTHTHAHTCHTMYFMMYSHCFCSLFLVPCSLSLLQQAHSAEYLVSFGVGAVIMNAAFLAVYYGARFATGKPLPAFHFRITWAPGLATGILWALGNYFR